MPQLLGLHVSLSPRVSSWLVAYFAFMSSGYTLQGHVPGDRRHGAESEDESAAFAPVSNDVAGKFVTCTQLPRQSCRRVAALARRLMETENRTDENV